MRWLLWKLFDWPSVVLIDFQGARKHRLVWREKATGRYIATLVGWNIHTVVLADDGSTPRLLRDGSLTDSYNLRWDPAYPGPGPSGVETVEREKRTYEQVLAKRLIGGPRAQAD